MPTQAYDIQLESRRLFLSLLCGAKKVNKVIPAAHIPRAQAHAEYAEIEIPASVLLAFMHAKDLQLRM
jgi:predicted membrane chloride channel (bestrophin family)